MANTSYVYAPTIQLSLQTNHILTNAARNIKVSDQTHHAATLDLKCEIAGRLRLPKLKLSDAGTL